MLSAVSTQASRELLYNEICLDIYEDCGIEKIKEKILSKYPKDRKFIHDFRDKTFPAMQTNKKARYLFGKVRRAQL